MAKILIVDDDPLMVKYLAQILQSGGHSTVGLTSGMEVLVKCQSFHPDVVIVDVWMPEMDGFETLRAIRGFEPNVRAVAMSGHPTYRGRRVREVAAEEGAWAFIDKPFSKEHFLAMVTKVIEAKEPEPFVPEEQSV